ncbi:hypothetical protein QJQ45_018624 [Haematococcus lacustris]|nr:hypothetical protein QJQ45_018624 [Haematococcus lacustris]
MARHLQEEAARHAATRHALGMGPMQAMLVEEMRGRMLQPDSPPAEVMGPWAYLQAAPGSPGALAGLVRKPSHAPMSMHGAQHPKPLLSPPPPEHQQQQQFEVAGGWAHGAGLRARMGGGGGGGGAAGVAEGGAGSHSVVVDAEVVAAAVEHAARTAGLTLEPSLAAVKLSRCQRLVAFTLPMKPPAGRPSRAARPVLHPAGPPAPGPPPNTGGIRHPEPAAKPGTATRPPVAANAAAASEPEAEGSSSSHGQGNDLYCGIVRDIAAGCFVPRGIIPCIASCEFVSDSSALLVTVPDALGRPAKVKLHSLQPHLLAWYPSSPATPPRLGQGSGQAAAAAAAAAPSTDPAQVSGTGPGLAPGPHAGVGRGAQVSPTPGPGPGSASALPRHPDTTPSHATGQALAWLGTWPGLAPGTGAAAAHAPGAVQGPREQAGQWLPVPSGVTLFEEADPSHFLEISHTKDWAFLTVNSNSKTCSEVCG